MLHKSYFNVENNRYINGSKMIVDYKNEEILRYAKGVSYPYLKNNIIIIPA